MRNLTKTKNSFQVEYVPCHVLPQGREQVSLGERLERIRSYRKHCCAAIPHQCLAAGREKRTKYLYRTQDRPNAEEIINMLARAMTIATGIWV